MAAEPWAVAEARFPTATAGRYLGQLCAHFGHRIPAVREGDRGSLEFPDGLCTLEADAEALRLRLAAADATALARLQEVVGSHLLRFAFREAAAALEWQPGAA
ncbi:DUF2218 domain-containing protein [Siccirubricoccus sp. KC 17139]|uniref:DUF2218 domain-containing protein n=1 Tax=Siccirubricoccus soli TaxID=2899147 RepID=A0ABT1D2X1_9PROT|nr:DUF2218 domain-containing protein [Siccirubricoccus soli]MCO6415350.1 DUF2218 domain-containing protein [Siccirubricoccus soli]MCP2681482.1 DUF2218 domain-containing protein [Siccirubricoccus soli]